MSQLNPEIDHLLRRAGFGISPLEVDVFRDMSTAAAVSYLVDYEGRPDDVDARIGRADHARVTSMSMLPLDVSSRTVETAGAAFVNSGESGFRSSSR